MNYYNEGKFWFLVKNNIVTVGIAQDVFDEIGEVNSLQFPLLANDEVKKDDVVCELRASDDDLKVYAPVSGKILEVNSTLAQDVGIINEDPLDEGWLIKIEMIDESELKEYF